MVSCISALKLCEFCCEYHQKCEICGKRTDLCRSKLCNECKEVTSRLKEFLKHKKGREEVKKIIKELKKEK